MTKPRKNRCDPIVLNAIRAVIPGFNHSCTSTTHKAVFLCGSSIDEYCIAVNGTKTNLLPSGQYKICRNLKYHAIDAIPDPPPGGNTTAGGVTADPPGGGGVTTASGADPPVVGATIPGDPPGGVVGGIMLPRTANIKQETSLAAAELAAAELLAGNDRIPVHNYLNRNPAIRDPPPCGGGANNNTSAASASSSRNTNTSSARY